MTIYEVINCSIVSYDISKSNVILTYNYNNFNYVDCLDFSTIYTVSQFTTKYYMIGLHVRSFYWSLASLRNIIPYNLIYI